MSTELDDMRKRLEEDRVLWFQTAPTADTYRTVSLNFVQSIADRRKLLELLGKANLDLWMVSHEQRA